LIQDVLQSDRLTLRPFEPDDAADVQRLAGNWKIADTTLNVPHPYDDGMAEEWISTHRPEFDEGKRAIFAVTRTADGQLIGAIGLTIDRTFDRAELGYWIGEPYWGSGYCSEAAKTVIRYAFEKLALNRIHACYLERNPASGKVLKKIGMTNEGVARQHIKKHGKFEDLVMCGLLRDERDDR
jgi:RimJ/RimL family protein N-acetyltransferase